jgi:hypothetical protein
MSNPRLRGEGGAALQLALVFLTAIALIVGALLGFAGESSQATVVTRTTRSTDYDADGAMQAAIATIRASTTQGVVGACVSITPTALAPPVALNNPARPVRVDCAPSAALGAQRNMVLSVCPSAVAAPCPDAQALLRADVTFYDDVSWGRAVSIQSWSNQ